MSPNIKDIIVSQETQKTVVRKLSSEQLFVLLVLGISSILSYAMITKITSQIDSINERLDKLIDLNIQNLSALKDHLIQDENARVSKK